MSSTVLRKVAAAMLVASTVLMAACSAIYQSTEHPEAMVAQPMRPQAQRHQPCFATAGADLGKAPGKYFDHILIVVLENQPFQTAIANPKLRDLAAQRGASLEEFYALFHPSYSNYLAMISGTGHVTIADAQRTFGDETIACLLHRNGLTWKNYAENYVPARDSCNTEHSRGREYARKHVPFLSFRDIQQDIRNGCSNVVSADDLFETLSRHEPLPNYMFFSPNMLDDGHDTGLDYAATWLAGFIQRLDAHPHFWDRTLMVVTFDESSLQDRNNHIYTALLGPMVRKGCSFKGAYTHYSILRLVEDNFQLGTLADGDGSARPIAAEVFQPGVPCP